MTYHTCCKELITLPALKTNNFNSPTNSSSPSPSPSPITACQSTESENHLVKAIENLLKKTDDCGLVAIAAASHSLTIAIDIFCGKLQIEESIELIRIEEDLQVDRWGLVEGGHDIDIADLRVQISSATVFLGLSRKN